MRTTIAFALCLFALAMACSRASKPLPDGYRTAHEDTLPTYGITETVAKRDAGAHFGGDADLGDRQ
jgi:hypothetical protein